MKRKGTIKKGIAWLMTAVMVFSITPVLSEPLQVQAVETQEATTTTTTKTIEGLGTAKIADPTAPVNDTDAWKGSYVYYGKYDSSPVKYRVLDVNTTKFGGTTMLLDCDSILYDQYFDNDATANEEGKKENDWSISDVKTSLNGDGFLNKEGVFTTAEKNAIAESNVDAHALAMVCFDAYVALTGEKIFLLDAEDVSNRAYGYGTPDRATENRKKEGGTHDYWWLRSAEPVFRLFAPRVGCVDDDGHIVLNAVSRRFGVSPALNLKLSSVIFSSIIFGTAGESGAEYKLTLLDDGMTIAANGDAIRYGKTVTIPYSISGTNSANATQVSVLVLDKEYTAGNTNGATVLDYQKLNVDSFSASGTGTYTLPDSLYRKECGTDYYMYILAEDVNGEKETDYAATPVAITPTWKAPTVKQMNFGTQGIIDPAVPNSDKDAWKGCYVYYGNYDGSPVKYRVLDANTTKFGGTTMLLDCDSILYYMPFDGDAPHSNVWKDSSIYTSLNGDDFLYKEGVFTTTEKNAIAKSNVDIHALTTDSETGVNVASWTQDAFVNYVALDGEQIFLLDAEDVSNGAYGYSMTDSGCENRKKKGRSADAWWLRSVISDDSGNCAGVVLGGVINFYDVDDVDPGVSPALNLNLSSVIFSSANAVSKSSALTSDSAEIGTTSNTEWKLTLKDDAKSVALTEGRSVTKANDGTITVPYTYTEKENATDKEKVNQISVMITDKVYDAEKAANVQEAQILYYGALQNIKNAEETDSTVAEASSGTGTFALPSGLTGALGTDYHIYLLAEHVNADNSTDYASEPKEVTAILDEVDTATVPSIDTPIAEQPLVTEITVSSKGVAEKATLTWKKNNAEVTGNAEWKTTYQADVTLTPADGYVLVDAAGNVSVERVTLNGSDVDTKNVTGNADGTLTVYCGKYTTATRKITEVTEPKVLPQFNKYYEAGNVLSSTELGTIAEVTLEGSTQPNTEEMEVEWEVVDTEGNPATYDVTPAATNTFKWTVKESAYKDRYDKNDTKLEGIVTIQNKDYTPVTIDGADATLVYFDMDVIDIADYFTIDKNAGTPTYELLDESTGNGTLEGTKLTMTTIGTFVIRVSTPVNGVYDKGETTITLTVERATPNVTELPEVLPRTYHPSKTLADVELRGGSVKSVSGNDLAGTWNWKRIDVIPEADNDGYVAVFTPEDTVHYEKVEKTISVNVSKATPYIKTVPTAASITDGEALSASTLKDAVVWYSESDEEVVGGTFTWKEAATKPTVADSGKTEYAMVFKPTDKDNYNEVETKRTLTVNKAEVAPNMPESTMNTVYTNETVGKVTLPEGWVWQDADKTKALEVGKAMTATAIYNGADKGNYATESVEISITRSACEHKNTTITNAMDAACSEKGYTGDIYCTECNAIIEHGTTIAALGHDYASAVTKEPTTISSGVRTYTCKRCARTYTETIAKLTTVAKATPYIDADTLTAEALTYGQTLADSAVQGSAYHDSTKQKAVAGNFVWQNGNSKPTAKDDSNNTRYTVIFKPTDSDNYNEVETEISITVNKALNAPNMPDRTKSVYFTTVLVGYAALTKDWVWSESDKEKELAIGVPVTATALYVGADKGNYENESVEVSITRQACTHTWDTSVVTKEATAAGKGEKTYTCSVCKITRTEDIPAHDAPKKGSMVAEDGGKATYKVTKSDLQNGTVTYVAPLDKKVTDVTIPATVTIDGVTFKVTAMEKNAFKKNKNIKSVTIGENVKTIGDKAFYKCTSLTKVSLPAKVQTIGKSAFYGCKKVTSVTVGKNVNKIGSKAFYGCSKLKTLTIKSAKLTKKKIGSKAFGKTPKSLTVKVPKKKFKAYKSMLIGRGVNKKAKFKKS